MKPLYLTTFLAGAFSAFGDFIIAWEPGAIVVKDDTLRVPRYHLQRPMDSKLSVDSGCYFHPLKTPSGITITDVAPSDHRDVRMLNPCIVASTSVHLKAGEPLLLRYRVVAHDGPV